MMTFSIYICNKKICPQWRPKSESYRWFGQKKRHSIANALGLRLSCYNQSIWGPWTSQTCHLQGSYGFATFSAMCNRCFEWWFCNPQQSVMRWQACMQIVPLLTTWLAMASCRVSKAGSIVARVRFPCLCWGALITTLNGIHRARLTCEDVFIYGIKATLWCPCGSLGQTERLNNPPDDTTGDWWVRTVSFNSARTLRNAQSKTTNVEINFKLSRFRGVQNMIVHVLP